MRGLMLALILVPAPVLAETAIAARTIPARTVLAAADLGAVQDDIAGGATPGQAIGQETRVTIFQGRPVLAANLTAPALVERNQLVRLFYQRGGLSIVAEGRALGRAAMGDTIRVLSIGSRAVLTGRVLGDGNVEISSSQ